MGKGNNLAYLDEKLSLFDNLDRNTFCNDMIDYMLQQLNYALDQLEIGLWCPPGKTVANMVPIDFEFDCLKMARASVHSKELVLFVNHVKRSEEDDIAYRAGPELPRVILSPISKDKLRHMKSESTEGIVDNAENSGKMLDSGTVEDPENSEISDNSEDSEEDWECDSGTDPTWYDSDYAMDEDDDLYDKNVDDAVKDALFEKGKQIGAEYRHVPGTDDVTEDDLKLPEEEDLEKMHKSDSDDEEYKKKKKKENPIYKFKTFNPFVDIENPQFKLGMVFDSVELVRKAVAHYAVKNRVQIKKKRNNKQRFEAICSEGCPWKQVAVADNRTQSFLVKTFVGEHNCEKVWDVKELTAPYLAKNYVEKFRDNDKMSLSTFGRKVRKKYNMEVSRHKFGRARKAALEVVHGDEVKQYTLLWKYAQELRTSNPGSSFYLNLEHGLFSTCYFSLAACKIGWLKGCRPIICLDGTFIKTEYGGQLLTAVGIDGNDSIYPIAMALVETECHASWSWFLATLKQDLNILNTSNFSIMSDKQKGLIKAVQEHFHDSEHRFCVRHL
ncbi:uncharacterized protein LOC125541485 [Triticum urartu]|uniref:uncharacterized protein LOC125541485 n=1 Tax=Triticum urartu TaxID=4572 RepID=UPI00204312A2|nr:uncharacterized protein LOC125541485 [Triticum urartu]